MPLPNEVYQRVTILTENLVFSTLNKRRKIIQIAASIPLWESVGTGNSSRAQMIRPTGLSVRAGRSIQRVGVHFSVELIEIDSLFTVFVFQELDSDLNLLKLFREPR